MAANCLRLSGSGWLCVHFTPDRLRVQGPLHVSSSLVPSPPCPFGPPAIACHPALARPTTRLPVSLSYQPAPSSLPLLSCSTASPLDLRPTPPRTPLCCAAVSLLVCLIVQLPPSTVRIPARLFERGSSHLCPRCILPVALSRRPSHSETPK